MVRKRSLDVSKNHVLSDCSNEDDASTIHPPKRICSMVVENESSNSINPRENFTFASSDNLVEVSIDVTQAYFAEAEIDQVTWDLEKGKEACCSVLYEDHDFENLGTIKNLSDIRISSELGEHSRSTSLEHINHNVHLSELEWLVHPLHSAQNLVEIQVFNEEIDSYSPTCSSIQAFPQNSHAPVQIVPNEPFLLPSAPSCSFCKAERFHREPKGFCCSDGDVSLVCYDSPIELWDLFTSMSKLAVQFRTYVRTYNNTFAFTSFGVKCDLDLCRRNKGIYTFKAQGQIYHYLNTLLPCDERPSYLQLYFYDTEHELQNRLALSDRMTPEIMNLLLQLLVDNPYCRFFRSLVDIPNLQDCSIVIRNSAALDQRVYNAPTVSQVAAIWVEGDENESSRGMDIIVHGAQNSTHRVQYYYGCYDPLQYPLLFPLGESGWHEGINRKKTVIQRSCNIGPSLNAQSVQSADELLNEEAKVMREGRQNKRAAVSCREYYSYKLQMRPNSKSVLLHSGRLLQQYVVDMYIKLESSRLDFIRNKQSQIRAELYQGIVDSIAAGEQRGCKIGSRVVLPASFIGGPRDMRRRYVDAMALVQQFGKPDLFLTMTCNPTWPEITSKLLPSEEAQNRPDLTTRVFRAKLEELKNDLFKKQVFGPVIAYVYVVEFQKRGLPHAHFLLILKDWAKIRSPTQYDQFVCAEIPHCSNHHLHHAVWKHMMHGPCGALNPMNVCMKKDGSCKNHYPKDFCEVTTETSDSYPLYRRRKNGGTIKVRNCMLDNRWVTPYNPYLLAKFDCHINVEICSTIKAVKYLYKYIYKGHDRVSFHVASNKNNVHVDEIANFQNARWISPPEAMWRIYRFSLTEIHPAVINLPLHLENQQSVTFHDSSNLQNVVQFSRSKRTMLTEYFEMNKRCSHARKLLYKEFPQYFVWNERDRVWERRKRGMCIGRIVTVAPTEGDRYYMRVMLNNKRGATSPEDLKTFNGKIASSFKEAALWNGFLQHDDSFKLCLMESCTYQMPLSLRRLFSTLLVYCNPVNARALWEQFAASMAEDFTRLPGISEAQGRMKALKDIAYQLESMGKNINEYMLIDEEIVIDEIERGFKEINDELNIEVPLIDIESVFALNTKQKKAYDEILDKVMQKEAGSYFIDGPGGTGKTFLYRALLATIRSKGYVALATASSGVAASILPGGRTAHSRFKIPVKDDVTTCSVTKQSGLARLLRAARIIIWDEAPMVKRACIEAFERMLRDICDSPILFGGKVVVFGGDFRQVLPVIPKATIEQTIESSFVKSPLWPHIQKIRLTENMRALHDYKFCDFLLQVGDGRLPPTFDDYIRIPSIMALPYNGSDSLNTLIELAFPNLHQYANSIDAMIMRAILTPKNDFVDEINNSIMEKFPGEFKEYRSFDKAIDITQEGLQEDLFSTITPTGFPPHILRLKKNCPVILLRNIDPSKGLCNGTRLICNTFEPNSIGATIAVGAHKGKHVFLPRIPLVPTENETNVFRFQRTQFPIRLSFAMTINKAQGQTLDFVGVYLPQPVFSHGQLYVALSRAKQASSVAVLVVPTKDSSLLREVTTRNVVYNEVLTLASEC